MLEAFNYSPILRTRNAELKALFNLGDQAKDAMFPMFVASPLPNANSLSHTWAKISEAFPRRRFALDLDRSALNGQSKKVAQNEFNNLFDSEDGYLNYYTLVQTQTEAVPVLRLNGNLTSIKRQLEHVEKINRGLFVRFEHDIGVEQIRVLGLLLQRGVTFLPVIDLGWSPDVTLRQIWADGILKIIETNSDERPFEIVFSASSFPDTFQKVGKKKDILISERVIFDSLSAKFNSFSFTYGDWASTRAKQPPAPMVPVPRIDLPHSKEWVIFRRFEEETYQEIASRVVSDNSWDPRLKIWGTNTIEWTKDGKDNGIKGPAGATAVRINIHLHEQALFGSSAPISDSAEPFTDDF